MKIDLGTLKKGEYARGELAIRSADRKNASNGPYALLVLTDGENEIIGKKWKCEEELPSVGSVIEVVAEVGAWKGELDLNIKKWSPGKTDISEFKKVGPQASEVLYHALEKKIEQLQGTPYYDVVNDIYKEHKELIQTAPAAMTVHHDYEGGFLQHTLEVVDCASALATVMNYSGKVSINLALLLAGALLHDIGKIYTYKLEGAAIEMTDEGQLLEHISVGMMLVQEVCNTHAVPSLERSLLLHCIASHHLNLEWGSPVTAKMPEAVLIHYADQVSAKVTIMNEARKHSSKTWTEKNFFLGTRVYNGVYGLPDLPF